jgi:thymidylate synthase (FAD)
MKLSVIASTQLKPAHAQFLRRRKLTWKRTRGAASGEELVEFAGRVCYLSFGSNQSPKDNSAYIANLIGQGHESVLEHTCYSVLADNISRALSHQLVRHRVGFAFSQLSQQYHDESDAAFVLPDHVQSVSDVENAWHVAIAAARSGYKTLLTKLLSSDYASGLSRKERLRAIRSIARSVLPNATSTTLVMTGNARAWRHLLGVRGAITGDPEMRSFCLNLLEVLRAEAPVLFADFRVGVDELGHFVFRKSKQ